MTTSKDKPYWHELPQEEIDKMKEEKKDWRYVLDNFRQPSWCNYPAALGGNMGCWSLVSLEKDGSRTRISEQFCRGCDEFKTNTDDKENS